MIFFSEANQKRLYRPIADPNAVDGEIYQLTSDEIFEGYTGKTACSEHDSRPAVGKR